METKGPTPETIQVLTYIGALTDDLRRHEARRREHVVYAHKLGASWRMIGVALGTSGQAAWETYRPDRPESTGLSQDTLPLDDE